MKVESDLSVFSRKTGTQILVEKQEDGRLKLTFSDLVLLVSNELDVEPVVGEVYKEVLGR